MFFSATIRCTFSLPLPVQFFGEHAVQFTGICTSSRLLHELADEEVECPFLSLPEVFDCCRVLGEHFCDGCPDGVGIRYIRYRIVHCAANEPFLRSSRSTIADGCLAGLVVFALVEHDPQHLNPALVGDGACFEEG